MQTFCSKFIVIDAFEKRWKRVIKASTRTTYFVVSRTPGKAQARYCTSINCQTHKQISLIRSYFIGLAVAGMTAWKPSSSVINLDAAALLSFHLTIEWFGKRNFLDYREHLQLSLAGLFVSFRWCLSRNKYSHRSETISGIQWSILLGLFSRTFISCNLPYTLAFPLMISTR